VKLSVLRSLSAGRMIEMLVLLCREVVGFSLMVNGLPLALCDKGGPGVCLRQR
jgi:hypothetical protein